MQTASYTTAIKAVSTISAVLTVLSPIHSYNGTLQSVATSFIHIPCALFGVYAVFVTLPFNTRFSTLACVFLVVNWGLI